MLGRWNFPLLSSRRGEIKASSGPKLVNTRQWNMYCIVYSVLLGEATTAP